MYAETTALLALFVMMLIGFGYVKRQVFTPWNTTLAVWIVVLLLYVTMDHGLYDVQPQVLWALMIWVPTFCFSSFAGYRFSHDNTKAEWLPNERTIDILTLLCLVIVPFGVLKAFQNAASIASPEGILFTIREQAIDPELYSMGPVRYFLYIVFPLFLIEANRPVLRRKRFTLMLVLGFLFFLMTMAKITFFMFAVGAMYILYVNRKISLKPLIFFFATFLFFAVGLQLLRGADSDADASESILWFLAVYIVSPLQAFCTEVANSSLQFGESSLRGIYHILYVLGMDVTEVETLDDFVMVPLPTNVYSIMSPYFRDFGYWGIFFFALFEGFVIGMIYRLGSTGHTIYKYVYTLLLVYLVLQFFDEQIFKNLIGSFYIVVVLLLCHTRFTFTSSSSSS